MKNCHGRWRPSEGSHPRASAPVSRTVSERRWDEARVSEIDQSGGPSLALARSAELHFSPLSRSPVSFVAAGDVVGVKAHFRSNGRDELLHLEHRLNWALGLIKANAGLTVALHHLSSRWQHCPEPSQELILLTSMHPRSNLQIREHLARSFHHRRAYGLLRMKYER
jgi:hypothetical protein